MIAPWPISSPLRSLAIVFVIFLFDVMARQRATIAGSPMSSGSSPSASCYGHEAASRPLIQEVAGATKVDAVILPVTPKRLRRRHESC
jgi:hypothetical protein